SDGVPIATVAAARQGPSDATRLAQLNKLRATRRRAFARSLRSGYRAAMQGVLANLFQHAAMTAGVTVRVAVNYTPDQSRAEARRWFWVYHIRIENHREDTIKLLMRHWRITDSRGMVNLVDGEGVVGETPVLAPGQTHDYVSGCERMTTDSSMEAPFSYVRADGPQFEVAIPFLPLSAPARTES